MEGVWYAACPAMWYQRLVSKRRTAAAPPVWDEDHLHHVPTQPGSVTANLLGSHPDGICARSMGELLRIAATHAFRRRSSGDICLPGSAEGSRATSVFNRSSFASLGGHRGLRSLFGLVCNRGAVSQQPFRSDSATNAGPIKCSMQRH